MTNETENRNQRNALGRCSIVSATLCGWFFLSIAQAQDTEPATEAAGEALGSLTETVVESVNTTPATASRPAEPTPYTPPSQVISTPSATPASTEPLVINDLNPVAAVAELPGSGYYVTATEIREQNYVNHNRVFARIPGVYTRDEMGMGILANISIRGAGGARTEKATIMEDGILTAPAPYSSPGAYYTPNMARMAGVEVLKGSSQVRFGPHTTGGVVNYLSTPIPEAEQLYARFTYGSDSTIQAHSHYGDTLEGDFGKVGYLAEIYHKSSDGYRNFNPGQFLVSKDDTGYSITEPMVKLSWEPNTILDQRFELKFGYSQADWNEGYLGLSDFDARNNPDTQYAGAFGDNMDQYSVRNYLKWEIDVNDNLSIDMAAYYNYFKRTWFKISDVNGQDVAEVVANPNGANFAVLTGNAAGRLDYGNNNRLYHLGGYQIETDYIIEGQNDVTHTLTTGFRYHEDRIRRLQDSDDYFVAPGQAPVYVPGGLGSGGNRIQETDATALWFQDKIEIGNHLTVVPGIRYEYADYYWRENARDSSNTQTDSATGNNEWWLMGAAFNYELSEANSVFGGVHEGVAAPGPRSFLNDGVRNETSIGYEIGLRHRSNNFNSEVGFFYTDLNDLLATQTGLNTQNSAGSNNGEANVYGVEYLASYDPWADRCVRMPMFASATWTNAHLVGLYNEGGAHGENQYGDAEGGPGIPDAELPYIPEWKLAFGVGLVSDCWATHLNATYQSDTWGTGLNGNPPAATSNVSGRQGIIDGGWIVDWSAMAKLNDNWNLIGGVHNIFDERMITSRLPEGPRVSAPRQGYIGFQYLWEADRPSK